MFVLWCEAPPEVLWEAPGSAASKTAPDSLAAIFRLHLASEPGHKWLVMTVCELLHVIMTYFWVWAA